MNIGEIKKGCELGYARSSAKYARIACPDCGKARWVQLRHDKPKHIFCSKCSHKHTHLSPEALKRISEAMTGEHHPNWRGGRKRHQRGYIEVWLPADDFFHPMANCTSYVLEHRLVMAKHLNRCLLPWEVVHHKGTKYPMGSDEDRGDNRIENLELYPTQKQHIPSTRIRAEFKKRDKQIAELQQRITLLEAQNALLQKQLEYLEEATNEQRNCA